MLYSTGSILEMRYRSSNKKKVVQEEVDKMLHRGVIEPSDGPWASPIVLVTKKDGSTRFWVNFRRLNEAIKKDAYYRGQLGHAPGCKILFHP